MKSAKNIAVPAAIGALYASLTIALAPISYGALQLRLSEALCLLPAVYPPAAWGLFVGCAAANLASPAGILDIVFGSLATLIAALVTSKIKRRWLAPLPMAVSNALIVGAVLAWTGSPDNFPPAFAAFAAEIAAGELIVGYAAGLPLLKLFEKLKSNLSL